MKRIQEYDLAEMGKDVIPAHLDDLVNVVCPLYHDSFAQRWMAKYIALYNRLPSRSIEVRRCSEISQLLKKELPEIRKCVLYSAPV